MGHLTRVAVLGATGSIGRQTLEVIAAQPGRFRAVALTAGHNSRLLHEQAAAFKPGFVHCDTQDGAFPGCQTLTPERIAAHPDVDVVVVATSGKHGLLPTLAAARAGKRIALANKETLVMAGEIVTAEARRCGAQIVPVDSEHSALWQCLQGEPRPARLVLTASGGPFYGFTAAQTAGVTVVQALAHPSWRMGKKITIDSATLMNKGLEVIEARWLFDMPIDNIDVVIHPQAVVHSLVEFADGSVKAQLSQPDMRLPIQYALSYPERLPNRMLTRLDWTQKRTLTFEKPDLAAFPCLGLAIEAGRRGATYPAVLSGADEAAVALFLAGRIKFTDIYKLAAQALVEHRPVSRPTIEEILAAEKWAEALVARLAGEG